MTFRGAWVTIKHHRVELAFALSSLIILAVASWLVNAQLLGVDAPSNCLSGYLQSAGGLDSACVGAAQAFIAIDQDEAGRVLGVAAALPIAAGLLVGVSLVGRELEARTAQVAWAIAASRVRWFASQLLPLAILLVFALALAGFATGSLEATRSQLVSSPFADDGSQGFPLVARGIAGLSLGTLLGTIVGRTLPAFVLGAVVAVGCVVGADVLRADWASSQPLVVVHPNQMSSFDGYLVAPRWISPVGDLLTDGQARALAEAHAAADDSEWLIDNGYEPVQIGITAATAEAWQPLELVATLSLGAILLASTVIAVDRRRPT